MYYDPQNKRFIRMCDEAESLCMECIGNSLSVGLETDLLTDFDGKGIRSTETRVSCQEGFLAK